MSANGGGISNVANNEERKRWRRPSLSAMASWLKRNIKRNNEEAVNDVININQ
jgi:hypothetical protein